MPELQIPTISPIVVHPVNTAPANTPREIDPKTTSSPLQGGLTPPPRFQGPGEQAPGVPSPQAPVPGPSTQAPQKNVVAEQAREKLVKEGGLTKGSPDHPDNQVMVRIQDGPVRGPGIQARVVKAGRNVTKVQVGNTVGIPPKVVEDRLNEDRPLEPNQYRGEIWVGQDDCTIIEGA